MTELNVTGGELRKKYSGSTVVNQTHWDFSVVNQSDLDSPVVNQTTGREYGVEYGKLVITRA
ncbi:MAG: hypothetical protein LBP91_04595 [Coriobacteriales bacterium]|jgi:hypothetical protein|nr:hypothetical protein [Coriobacteriales bacterium]